MSRWFSAGAVVSVCITAGCADPAGEREAARISAEPPPAAEQPADTRLSPEDVDLSPLSITDGSVVGADGSTLLTIDQVPSNIRVDPDTKFGAADRFLDASLSPDGRRMAVTTAGAAHSAGWLASVQDDGIHPAAFQYGGSIEIGPWREDGRFVVFAHEGPGPVRTISVADAANPGRHVEASSSMVRIADEPEGANYRAIRWESDRLIFDVDGESYRYEPGSGSVEPPF